MIKVATGVTPQFEFIGNEQTPIIIIDDYIEQPQALINYANTQCNFSHDNQTQYPGIRAKLEKSLVVDYLQPLIKGLYSVYKIDNRLKPIPKDNYFSLITTPESRLTKVQTMPHFDTNDPNLIAIIHYIGNGEHGGIGFFRHKETGYELIDHQHREKYLLMSQKKLSTSFSDTHYCTEKNADFECYKSIKYKPNRLIVFPGYLLHSSLVNPESDINSDPLTGRLTANMFVQFK